MTSNSKTDPSSSIDRSLTKIRPVREISDADLRELWHRLGIKSGMVILCHSFLPSLGLIKQGPEAVVNTLVESIGNSGTLIVPTFTYSYFNDEVYDVERSPSTVGVLGDIVRMRPDAVRSLDPNFSMAAIGHSSARLMERTGHNSFGPDSIFDKLMLEHLQILLIGVDFTALSLFMYFEKLHKVVYRYDKSFSGFTRYKGQQFADTVVHFVRDLEQNPDETHSRLGIGRLIDTDDGCIKAHLGYGEHRLVAASTIARIVQESLSNNPLSIIK